MASVKIGPTIKVATSQMVMCLTLANETIATTSPTNYEELMTKAYEISRKTTSAKVKDISNKDRKYIMENHFPQCKLNEHSCLAACLSLMALAANSKTVTWTLECNGGIIYFCVIGNDEHGFWRVYAPTTGLFHLFTTSSEVVDLLEEQYQVKGGVFSFSSAPLPPLRPAERGPCGGGSEKEPEKVAEPITAVVEVPTTPIKKEEEPIVVTPLPPVGAAAETPTAPVKKKVPRKRPAPVAAVAVATAAAAAEEPEQKKINVE